MLVVSAETARGGDKINEIREKNGLNKLDVYYVPLLENDDFYFEEEESKVSSSNIRIRLLGTLLKPPEVQLFMVCFMYKFSCKFFALLSS